jgi:hypothetical protein
VQSAATVQAWFVAQVLPCASQVGPPQSVAVSLPSFSASVHDTHVPGPAPKQTLFTQSVFFAQCFLSAHAAQAGFPLKPAPPQSTSVSFPFCTPSLHVGG